ncbi:Smr/MutS family protein [Pseudofulvibacter geojedonensis]|uniref:Smr/MutS family protein n=1 Tax=Pseudofulvibacter geojedonensis TaxID=1123758 RepID=A0ABW3I0Y7_9FLAO
MSFQINDTVSVIDDALDGVVIAINGKEITIETSDGFPMKFQANELVRTRVGEYHFKGIQQAKANKEVAKRKQNKKVPAKQRDAAQMVVDLHIEKLVKTKKGMSNYDILSLQLDTAQHRLELAIQKRFQKIVFIHGVGDGVLKADLYSLFRRYDRIQFYEASYAEYGQGATEIRILQQNT